MGTLNMKKGNIMDFKKLVKEEMESGSMIPILGLGKSGIGKTVAIYEVTQELGVGFCEIRLAIVPEVDLLGLPSIDSDNRTAWSPGKALPDVKRDGERGILVIDEVTAAPTSRRAAIFQLLDSKRALGDYKLPEGWMVVSIGNGPYDGGVFQGIEEAYMSRGFSIRIEPDLKIWKKWAVGKGINPTIIAFLSAMPEYLHKYGSSEEGYAQTHPCPRSWEMLSIALNRLESLNGNRPLDQETIDVRAGYALGEEAAATFGAFYAYNRQIISVEDILDGKASTEIGSLEPQVMYIIVQNLVRAISQEVNLGRIGVGRYKDETVRKIANACNWIVGIGDYSLDLAIMSMTDLSQNVTAMTDIIINGKNFDQYCPQFIEFAGRNNVIFGFGEGK